MPFADYKDFEDCCAKNSDKKDPKAYCATIMKATEKPAKEIEAFEGAEFAVDETGKMTADVVLIKAGRAINPRNYRASALQKAVKEGVYNDARMFINHSDKPPIKRDFREMVSAVESTSWDPSVGKQGGIRAKVQFFNKDFFEYAQAAKKYIGVSADHRIRVQPAMEGSQRIDDVLEVAFARSVDWVLYPSAGGEILNFARESEGEDQVDWDSITLDELKANAPGLVEQLKAEMKPATEGAGTPERSMEVLSQEQIEEMIAQGVARAMAQSVERDAKRQAAAKSVREAVGKSGLPQRVQTRIVSMFADALEYDEGAVKSTIDDAKEELKELGVGPKITGEGPTGTATGGKPSTTHAREGVESIFGFKTK